MSYGHKDYCAHPGDKCSCEKELEKKMKFYKLIKILRGSRSIREIAKLSNISAATISRLERQKEIDIKTLRKLLKFYVLNRKDILKSLELL